MFNKDKNTNFHNTCNDSLTLILDNFDKFLAKTDFLVLTLKPGVQNLHQN